MPNSIFRKGLIIGLIILFIGAGVVPTISGYANYKNVIKLIENNSYNKGEVDLIIEGSGLWTPAPWDETGDYLNYKFSVYNIGERYTGELTIKLGMYCIYPDEEVYYNLGTHVGLKIHIGLILKRSDREIINEKPEKIRFEVEKTNVNESNTDNNDFTVTVDNGVTIYGTVYRRSLSGELHPPGKDAIVRCNSDISPFDFRYVTGANVDYILTVPKKAGAPPFIYTVKAEMPIPFTSDYRNKIKFSPPLGEFTYIEINFIFDSIFNMNNEEVISVIQQSQTTQQQTTQQQTTQQQTTQQTTSQPSTIQQTQTIKQIIRSNFLNRLIRR